MIVVKNVDYEYKKSKARIFKDFTLQIAEGNVCGLLGKNGAGKSTLLYLISGMLFPQRGEITVNGFNASDRKPEAMEELFLVPEEFELPNISLQQYVRYTATFYPKFDLSLMVSCLSDFDLSLNLHLGQLSMGQKKKVFMCFALATNVKTLIMDEPTNGLDIPSKSQFRKVISRCMNDERTILISTHQVGDVEQLLDKIVIIDQSEVLLNETVTTITDKLSFGLQEKGEPADNTLYIQPGIQGNYVVTPNHTGEPSNINLEMLFNAALTNREKIQAVFNK